MNKCKITITLMFAIITVMALNDHQNFNHKSDQQERVIASITPLPTATTESSETNDLLVIEDDKESASCLENVTPPALINPAPIRKSAVQILLPVEQIKYFNSFLPLFLSMMPFLMQNFATYLPPEQQLQRPQIGQLPLTHFSEAPAQGSMQNSLSGFYQFERPMMTPLTYRNNLVTPSFVGFQF